MYMITQKTVMYYFLLDVKFRIMFLKLCYPPKTEVEYSKWAWRLVYYENALLSAECACRSFRLMFIV